MVAEAPPSLETVAGAARVAQAPEQAPPVRTWLDVTVALLLLAIVGASVVLAVNQIVLPFDRQVAFLQKNVLEARARNWLVPSVLVGLALPPGLALGLIAWRGRRFGDAVWRAAWLVSPLALLWAIPSLLAYNVWYNNPAPYLIFLAVFVLAAEQILRRFFEVIPPTIALKLQAVLARRSERVKALVPFSVVLVAAIGYSTFAAHHSLIQHWRFGTAGYDLGIYDNLIFNNMSGRLFRCPLLAPNLSYLSNHAEFGTILIVPLYALRPGPELLLVLQSVFIGGAAIPLYLFATTQIGRGGAVLMAIAYLIYAPLHGPNFYDFHWVPMAMPLWFTLFFAIARRKKWLIVLSILCLLPIREEVGVMLAVLGAFLIVTNYWQRLGIVLAVLGGLWFGSMRFVIMPLAGTWWFDNMYADLIPPGEQGFGGVVRTLLTNPNYVWKTLATETKLTFALHLFAPLAFLPMRRLALIIVAIPGFFFTLLTTNYPHTLSIRFQYTAHWIPWLFATSILMLKIYRDSELWKVRYRAVLGALGLGIFCHSFVFGAVLQQNVFVGGFNRLTFSMTPEEVKRYQTAKRMIAKIPREASVAATENESAHIATRIHAYTLNVSHGNADYFFLRGSSLGGDLKKKVQEAMNKASYGLLDSGEDLYLFKKNHDSPRTTEAMRKLGLHNRRDRRGAAPAPNALPPSDG